MGPATSVSAAQGELVNNVATTTAEITDLNIRCLRLHSQHCMTKRGCQSVDSVRYSDAATINGPKDGAQAPTPPRSRWFNRDGPDLPWTVGYSADQLPKCKPRLASWRTNVMAEAVLCTWTASATNHQSVYTSRLTSFVSRGVGQSPTNQARRRRP